MRAVAVVLGAVVLTVSGCASSSPCSHRDARIASGAPGQQAELATSLLFDAKPGLYRASDFAYRSDWPSTTAFYSPGQVISFTERIVDYGGHHFTGPGHAHRRFDSYRTGIGYR